uniref:Membrane-spanning 4-domains subfamily A member 4A-like n=1 Tax=Electrophorus electricus TaxID=8005 RepID=A0A4W4FLC0_ELEEL
MLLKAQAKASSTTSSGNPHFEDIHVSILFWWKSSFSLEMRLSLSSCTIQIMIGLMTILFGIVIVHHFTFILYTGITFWGSLFYIVSGSLTVAASNKPHRCVVISSLVLNVISAVSAGIAVTLFSLHMAFGPYIYNFYDQWAKGMSGVLLVFSVLQFVISIIVSTFACKTTCTTEPSHFKIPDPDHEGHGFGTTTLEGFVSLLGKSCTPELFLTLIHLTDVTHGGLGELLKRV